MDGFSSGMYSKCSKVLYSKVADKMTYGKQCTADPDQTAEALLMGTHNIYFFGEMRKILCGSPLLSWAIKVPIFLHKKYVVLIWSTLMRHFYRVPTTLCFLEEIKKKYSWKPTPVWSYGLIVVVFKYAGVLAGCANPDQLIPLTAVCTFCILCIYPNSSSLTECIVPGKMPFFSVEKYWNWYILYFSMQTYVVDAH